MARCQRDIIGHGTVAPAAEWPNGAKIAIQIVPNCEEGGADSILHGDAASEPPSLRDYRWRTRAGQAARQHGTHRRMRRACRFLAGDQVADRSVRGETWTLSVFNEGGETNGIVRCNSSGR